jgi:hypothetical protein
MNAEGEGTNMNEKVKVIVTKAELGLLYLAVCELLDKKAGTELDRNDLVHNQLIDLRHKLNTVALSKQLV